MKVEVHQKTLRGHFFEGADVEYISRYLPEGATVIAAQGAGPGAALVTYTLSDETEGSDVLIAQAITNLESTHSEVSDSFRRALSGILRETPRESLTGQRLAAEINEFYAEKVAKKYGFTDETHPTLRRIVALRAIPRYGVEVGDKGGWLESEANLSHEGDAWVSGEARVSGDAEVSGYARVSGDARVYGDAEVFGYATVFGNAGVFGNAKVSGDAAVSGGARVFGDAKVFGNAGVFGDAAVSGGARVFGDAEVFGGARVSGAAWVFGGARVYGDAEVSGYATVFGNAGVFGDAEVSGAAQVSGDTVVSK